MKLRFGVSFENDNGLRYFGEGPYRLLRMVEEMSSLRAAAQCMGMAYTKAFHLIKQAEENLGFPLIKRSIGGKGGGGSSLTLEAKELVRRYEAYRAACDHMAEELYQKHFSDFLPEASSNYRK